MKSLRYFIKKVINSTLFLTLFLGIFVNAVFAQTSGFSFGIRPTKALEGQEETFSYFSYRTSPGSVFNDEALVLNDGDESVALRVYVADAITSQNGGTDFVSFGESATGFSQGASNWISLSASEITLAPGEEQVVPFQVSIPVDASPGQHIAGLVVEAKPAESSLGESNADADGGDAQFKVEVIRRVGVAVVMDIPGERITSLIIDNVFLYQQNEEGATFAVTMTNAGNVFLKSTGFFVVTDRTGESLITTIPLEFDTILPGDTVTYYVPRPVRFNDGEYLISVLLESEGQKATLEGVGMRIKKGQPELEGVIQEGVFSPEEVEVFFERSRESGSSLWVTIAVISFVLAFIVGGLIYWVGGKKEQKTAKHTLG